MTVNIEWFLGCVIADTELTLDDKAYPYINEASFGEDWIEMGVLVRYSEERNYDDLVKPLREAKKITIVLNPYPTSKRGPQVQRTFDPVRLIAERYETRPIWHGRTEADRNQEGKNAPAWYCVFRFEAQLGKKELMDRAYRLLNAETQNHRRGLT